MRWKKKKPTSSQSDRMYERRFLRVALSPYSSAEAIVAKEHPLLCGPSDTWSLRQGRRGRPILFGVSRGWTVTIHDATGYHVLRMTRGQPNGPIRRFAHRSEAKRAARVALLAVVALVLLLVGCGAEDDPGGGALHDDPRYCQAVNAERERQYNETHLGTLACETWEDCPGDNCICGGCGLPPSAP